MTTTNKTAGAAALTRAALHLARAESVSAAAVQAEFDRAAPGAIKFLRQKAASAGGSLSAETWGDAIADADGAAAGFLDAIRPRSVFYSLAEAASVFPLRRRVAAIAALEFGGGTAESAWLPVLEGGADPVLLQPRQAGGIVVLTRELVNATDPASFATLQRELQRAAVAAVDDVALAVVQDAVTPQPFDPATPLAAIRTLLDAVAVTGGEQLMFAAGPTMANLLATAEAVGGARLFPEMGPTGGDLLRVPCVVTDRLPAGRLLLVNASAFAANRGGIDIDRARAAALRMRTDPTGPAELVSLFQTGSEALRVVAAFGLERLRAGAVASADLGVSG